MKDGAVQQCFAGKAFDPLVIRVHAREPRIAIPRRRTMLEQHIAWVRGHAFTAGMVVE